MKKKRLKALLKVHKTHPTSYLCFPTIPAANLPIACLGYCIETKEFCAIQIEDFVKDSFTPSVSLRSTLLESIDCIAVDQLHIVKQYRRATKLIRYNALMEADAAKMRDAS